MPTLDDLKEKIQTLESERSHLRGEIETLRKAAEIRAAALESSVNQMREEVKVLRDLLGQSEKIEEVAHSQPVRSMPAPEPVFNAQVNSDAESELNESLETSTPTEAEPENTTSPYDSLLKTLNADERKVVDVLMAHDGKYSQKFIREEAGLNWLQTNRVISRLADRGIISFEKEGKLGNVVLTNGLK